MKFQIANFGLFFIAESLPTVAKDTSRMRRRTSKEDVLLAASLLHQKRLLTPENDDVCDAISLPTDGNPVVFDNTFATAQVGEVSPGPGTGSSSCHSNDGWCSFDTDIDSSLWYTIVAPSSGCVTIKTTTGVDTQLALWSVGDCNDFGTFEEVAANDDGGVGAAARLFETCVIPGDTYYVQLDGNGGCTGEERIIAEECEFPPVPSLSVDLGDCQSRVVNDADDTNDLNYIIPNIMGGSGDLSCSWTGDGIKEDRGCMGISVQPTETTEYCISVVDQGVCVEEPPLEVCVTVEVVGSCGKNGNKVQICNVPPGNPDAAKEACVAKNAMTAHMAKGSYVGPCDLSCTAANPPFV